MNENIFDKLDDAQKIALKTTKNSVITAGAGSGKTHVLALRFAWLIMTGQAKVDEILTLTFTNKAAAEMYQRIYQTLNNFAEKKQDYEVSDENWIKNAKQAIQDFSSAHIQTLDSYCSYIVRQCANRYGIKPDFSTQSSTNQSSIKEKALKFTLKNLNEKGIQTFCEAGKIQEFSTKVIQTTIWEYTNLSTPKDFFTQSLSIQLKEIVSAFNHYICGKSEEFIKFLKEDKETQIPTIPNSLKTIESMIESADAKTTKEKYIYFEHLKKNILTSQFFNIPPITENDVKNNSEFLKQSLKIYNEFKKQIYLTTTMTGKLDIIKKVISSINKSFDFLDSIVVFITQYDSLVSLNKLFEQFLHDVNSTKRTTGNLSFSDISALALKILCENEDIRNQEKNSYKKIMIDEFQDNNSQNRDLLYILSLKNGEFEDNGKCIIDTSKKTITEQIVIRDENNNIIEDKRDSEKLFFVGDEKQSIYKFRGAEVSVFNSLTKENEVVYMNFNHRSKNELVNCFNKIFKGGNGIFQITPESKDEQKYEAYYKVDAQKKEGFFNQITQQNVPLHINFCNEKAIEESTDYLRKIDQISFFIAKKIHDIYKNQQENSQKTPSWNDFAILDKKRTNRKTLTKYLNYFNIPYEIDSFNNIFEEAIINDFYNFLRICVYPSDVNSFMGYLTSPFCNVTENSAEIIISILNSQNEENKIFNAFNLTENQKEQIKNQLCQSEFDKFILSQQYLTQNRKDVLCQKITTTITKLWHEKGYKYETLLNNQVELCAEYFDMFFELARTTDAEGKTVSWFVDELENQKETYNSDSEIDLSNISYPLERKEAVKIMTVHKSKGLQFKHVFIYGFTDIRANSEKSELFFDEQIGMSIKCENRKENYFFERQKSLSQKKELAEIRRLIYVAITRAIEDVFIVGSYNPNQQTFSTELKIFEKIIAKYNKNFENPLSFFCEECGFDFNEIELKTYQDLQNNENDFSLQELREKIINSASKTIENAQIIQFLQNPIQRKTPSSLEKHYFSKSNDSSKNEDNIFDSDSGEKFEKDDDELTVQNFTSADFGTLAHLFLQNAINGIDPKNFYPPVKYLKNLTENQITEKLNECRKMTNDFFQSELGTQFLFAKQNNFFYKAEYAFRMFEQNQIFTGSIDLIFQNKNEKYTIVDYKTDVSIKPEIYTEQQKCYKKAASKLLKIDEKNIFVKLYYLRHNKIIDIE